MLVQEREDGSPLCRCARLLASWQLLAGNGKRTVLTEEEGKQAAAATAATATAATATAAPS